ncbi:hypothetical protein [Natronobeatus ordinarius]|uniref:hypothetical protein n=1 Tax=Natronobeatus ordinarius TaxID=2963433 RepID=UPI0020CB9771|nr:hypothetical protein [Natronobeatus ordinarius]
MVGDERISPSEVGTAIERSNRISSDSRVTEIRTGKEANASLRERYGDDFQPG